MSWRQTQGLPAGGETNIIVACAPSAHIVNCFTFLSQRCSWLRAMALPVRLKAFPIAPATRRRRQVRSRDLSAINRNFVRFESERWERNTGLGRHHRRVSSDPVPTASLRSFVAGGAGFSAQRWTNRAFSSTGVGRRRRRDPIPTNAVAKRSAASRVNQPVDRLAGDRGAFRRAAR
jgi:hypothetical protein